jgi:hypothetical protein
MFYTLKKNSTKLNPSSIKQILQESSLKLKDVPIFEQGNFKNKYISR